MKDSGCAGVFAMFRQKTFLLLTFLILIRTAIYPADPIEPSDPEVPESNHQGTATQS